MREYHNIIILLFRRKICCLIADTDFKLLNLNELFIIRTSLCPIGFLFYFGQWIHSKIRKHEASIWVFRRILNGKQVLILILISHQQIFENRAENHFETLLISISIWTWIICINLDRWSNCLILRTDVEISFQFV